MALTQAERRQAADLIERVLDLVDDGDMIADGDLAAGGPADAGAAIIAVTMTVIPMIVIMVTTTAVSVFPGL